MVLVEGLGFGFGLGRCFGNLGYVWCLWFVGWFGCGFGVALRCVSGFMDACGWFGFCGVWGLCFVGAWF